MESFQVKHSSAMQRPDTCVMLKSTTYTSWEYDSVIFERPNMTWQQQAPCSTGLSSLSCIDIAVSVLAVGVCIVSERPSILGL